MGDVVRPPPGLSDQELLEWTREQQDIADREAPREVVMPEMNAAPAMSSLRHYVFPPGTGNHTDEYVRLYPYFWFACEDRDRATDEAMLLDGHCRRCDFEEQRRGLPISPLPPLPGDAPRLRDLP